MNRRSVFFSTVWLCLGLGACERARVPAPAPNLQADATGALFGVFPDGSVGEFLAEHALPVPEPPLGRIEGGSCEAFAVALRAFATTPHGEAAGTLGQFFHAYGRAPVAEGCYALAARSDPDGAHWPHYRADLAEARGDLERAFALFEDARKLAPEATAPRARLARLHLGAGASEEARRELEWLLSVDPDSLFARTELAAMALADGELAAALEHVARAQERWPNQRRVLLLAGELADASGDEERAAALREQAATALEMGILNVDPWMARLEAVTNSLLYARTRADELQRARRWDEFLEVAGDLARREGGVVWPARQAQALLTLGRIDEGLGRAASLVEAFPEAPHGYEVLGLGRLARGELRPALEAAEQAIARDPRSRLGHEVLVKALLGAGLDDRAVASSASFRRAYPGELRPLLLELSVHQALAERARGRADAAEAAWYERSLRDVLATAEALSPAEPRVRAARAWLAHTSTTDTDPGAKPGRDSAAPGR